MQEKQKVTLYLSPELHRKLKIRAAVDAEPMSTIVERAVVFYLAHPELVDEVEASYGQSHQVYNCPECTSSVVIQNGEMLTLKNQPGVLDEAGQALPVQQAQKADSNPNQPGEELVPC
jgi:hypothetical protein